MINPHYQLKMFNAKNEIINKAVSLILAIYRLSKFIYGFPGVWGLLKSVNTASPGGNLNDFSFIGFMLLTNLMIPLGALVAGIAGLKQAKWATKCIIFILLVIFIKNLVTTIFFISAYYLSASPKSELSSTENIQYLSMIPTYITTAISGIFLCLVLTYRFRN